MKSFKNFFSGFNLFKTKTTKRKTQNRKHSKKTTKRRHGKRNRLMKGG